MKYLLVLLFGYYYSMAQQALFQQNQQWPQYQWINSYQGPTVIDGQFIDMLDTPSLFGYYNFPQNSIEINGINNNIMGYGNCTFHLFNNNKIFLSLNQTSRINNIISKIPFCPNTMGYNSGDNDYYKICYDNIKKQTK